MPDANSSTLPDSPVSFRIPIEKQTVVQALLSEGCTHRSIEKAVGINRATIAKIGKQELVQGAQAEKIKKGLRNRWAILAEKSLTAIKPSKLKGASAKDLAYIAAKATEMAGLSPPSIVETYTKSIQSFLVPETPPQVVGTETVTKTVVSPTTNES